jgi:ribosomal-protein-alanine N-acetyltransferase
LNWDSIETPRLILRGLDDSDVEFIYKQFSDEFVCKYLYDAEPFSNLSEAKQLIDQFSNEKNKTITRWILIEKSTNHKIGTCGYHFWDNENNSIEVGYDIMKEYCNKGIMKEALIAIINIAFYKKGLNRIQAFVSIENIASYRLLEKLGFKREGIIRDKHYFRGKYYDHFCYSLLKKEWK